jgi:hypothetical protein
MLHWTRPRMRLSVKERRMKLAKATNLNGKSGVAKWRDLRLSQQRHNPLHLKKMWKIKESSTITT